MILALLLIAAASLACVFFVMGWGALARRAFGASALGPDERIDDFWLGFALLIAFLQIWHLLRPVEGIAFTLFTIVGVAGWVPLRPPRDIRDSVHASFPRSLWAAALVVGVALLTAYCCLGSLYHYDTRLYHYPAVQWVSSYPIVPGLANLHGRFGFNSAYALFTALLDRGPFEARAYHLVNGVVLLPALLQSAWTLVRLLFGRVPPTALALFTALMLGPLTGQLPQLVGLSNDVPTFVLGFALSRLLIKLLTSSVDNSRHAAFSWSAFVAVAMAGVALKTSFALLAGPTLLSAFVALAIGWPRPSLLSLRRVAGLAFVAGGLLLLPWFARGYLLSGYPLYPSTFGALDVPWRVPRSLVLSEAYSIRAHARQRFAFWTQALTGWGWLTPWWERASRVLLLPFQVSAAALLALVLRCAFQRDKDRLRLSLYVLAPAILAQFAWFFTAPAPRFAGAAPWLVPVAGCALLLFSRAREISGPALWLVRLVCLAFLLVAMQLDDITDRSGIAGFEPFEPMRTAAAHPRTTDSGDEVFIPDVGLFCNQVRLPCTPYFRRNLRFLRPGEPGRGFALDPGLTLADIGQRTPDPPGLSASTDLGVCVIASGGCYSDRRSDRIEALVVPLELLVYSDRPVLAELSIRPRSESATAQRRAGSLRVSAHGRVLMTLPLAAEETLTATLRLPRDFTVISLSVEDAATRRTTPAQVPIATLSLRTLAER
jgi:hypothetical protein